MANGQGKSDRPIVAKKPPNKAPPGAAEGVAGRAVAALHPGPALVLVGLPLQHDQAYRRR
jgi:hypothetical protein